ncbi:MAG: DUF2797 domain-containing protein [bacterium]
MNHTGHIQKMQVDIADTLQYYLPLDEQRIHLNPLLGEKVSLQFSGEIHCIHCGRKTKKSFSQGHCYPCSKKLASCDMCILKPELCHYAAGTCREPEWGLANCFQDHFIYLSNTSGLKVGITRHSQIPTRWIDQGATQAMTLYRVKERLHSGLIEVALAQYVADKTNWRTMLKGNADPINLAETAEQLINQASDELNPVIEKIGEHDIERLDSQAIELNYPVLEFPLKIRSHNAEKTPLIEGTLIGLKGQYMIFDTGVINMRKYTAYEMTING